MIEFDRGKDLIAIVAPASSISGEQKKLLEIKRLLEIYGFQSTYYQEMLAGTVLPYFAASKELRVQGFKEALANPNVKIIWPFRGGYGAAEVAFECINSTVNGDKVLIGFSDITILHLLFNQQYNLFSIHASVLTSLLSNQASMIDEILNTLSGQASNIHLTPLNNEASKLDKIQGKIIGGNLTVFTNAIGTKLHPQTAGKILLFEDINEKGYHVHRHLLHLYAAGIFQEAEAVIFADFTQTDDYLEDSLEHFCQNYLNLAVYRTKGIGHGEINHPITLGYQAKISNSILEIPSPFKIV